MTLVRIPTNIITGFLGVGKTTAIMHLLQHKPEHERWAVLVNEFGEIGIDGAILRQSGAFVREVPGGCMCCVMGVPMQVGIRRLIAESRPDRLLVEPTGLGHPDNIVKILEREFAELLELRATVTLVDPRNLEKPRYLDNGNFRDQIALADVLVANKVDLSTESQMATFHAYAAALPQQPLAVCVANAELDPHVLDQPRRTLAPALQHHHHHEQPADFFAIVQAPTSPEHSLRRENAGQGFFSCGWIFHPAVVFDFDRLFNWITGLSVDRVKAVMITDQGIAMFNLEGGVVKVLELEDTSDSRIELIDSTPQDWNQFESGLESLRRARA